MTEVTHQTHHIPWVSRAAFPLVSGIQFLSQVLLAISVARGWFWLCVPLVLIVSHLMHASLIAYHEATHRNLRKSAFLNDLDGMLIGLLAWQSFTLYRVLHQSHHMHLATEKDVELWPFVHPDAPLWKRRLVAFFELTFGMFFTPFLFWRAFFCRDSVIRNKRVRRRIGLEGLAMVVAWSAIVAATAHFQLWPWFWWNYFIPGFIAGNLQSWRKYIEHVGMSGHTARSATRSIVADTWLGRAFSVTLLHEPLHGIHHIKSAIPHSELPQHAEWLNPEEEGDTTPFPNYRSALADLLRRLPDPRVGNQWNTAAPD